MLLLVIAFCAASSPVCDTTPVAQSIDTYLKPFVATNNFSGSVLVTKQGSLIFKKSYGFADRESAIGNTADTRFHIASMSMLFTAFATMRLVEQNELSLDEPIGDIVSGLPNGDRVTVRELLEETSGLPDANDLANYDALLRGHQTPASLVQQIRGLKPLAEPGGKNTHEEHSAYNVLALIIERKTGLPFAQAMQKLVFEPAGLQDSGADDDSPVGGRTAVGYNVHGEFGLQRADTIHWSAKPGNGSDYSTAADISKWFNEFIDGRLLSAQSRAIILATDKGDVGFGWDWKGFDERFGEPWYLSSGRSPGFSSVMLYLPNQDVTVIVLTNIEHASSSMIGENIASIVVGKPYKSFEDQPVSLTMPQRQRLTGQFRFGADFYRPNATLGLKDTADGLVLEWPGGPEDPLLWTGTNTFIDRYYWVRGKVDQDEEDRPLELEFGTFRGRAVPVAAQTS